jgi:hypothetical protein
MSTLPMSFEAKIALALQGSNWQTLQNAGMGSNTLAVPPETLINASVTAEGSAALGDNFVKPPDMTAKQKKKKERFDQKIAKDTGDVLQLIEADSITPVPASVSKTRHTQCIRGHTLIWYTML